MATTDIAIRAVESNTNANGTVVVNTMPNGTNSTYSHNAYSGMTAEDLETRYTERFDDTNYYG